MPEYSLLSSHPKGSVLVSDQRIQLLPVVPLRTASLKHRQPPLLLALSSSTAHISPASPSHWPLPARQGAPSMPVMLRSQQTFCWKDAAFTLVGTNGGAFCSALPALDKALRGLFLFNSQSLLTAVRQHQGSAAFPFVSIMQTLGWRALEGENSDFWSSHYYWYEASSTVF